MKLAFVTQPWDEVVPIVGGSSSIGIIAYQIARQLVARDCQVTIYANKGESQEKIQIDQEGIQYRRIRTGKERLMLRPFRLLERFLGYPNPKRPLFASKLYHYGYILQVAKDLKKHNSEVVHIFNFSQFIPMIRALNPDIKIVLHMQCEWLTQLDSTLVERRLGDTDLVLGCSDYITEKIRRGYPKFADICSTAYNGVDEKHFIPHGQTTSREKDGIKRLLFVGRISPEKGVHVLLDALEKVISQLPETHLDIVGSPGEAPFEFIVLMTEDEKVSELAIYYSRINKLRGKTYFPQLMEQLSQQLENKVTFLGPNQHLRMVDYYRRADVFVFPSVWDEPFGMPLIEAMACQVPVVATQSGGMVEIVEDGRTGLLVERGNAEMLANAIIKLLKDEKSRRSMGNAGRQRVLEHFTWDCIARKLLKDYKSLL